MSTSVKAVATRSAGNWWRSPQRTFLRRALFQVHLWTGIALALYAIAIGISGSALVFKDELEQASHPNLYRLSDQAPKATVEQSVRSIEAARPGWKAFALEDFAKPHRATTVLLHLVDVASTPNYRMISFNPATGEVLFDRMRYDGVLGWLDNLHVYLLSGQTGLLVSGWMGVGLLVLSFTGIALWWPGVQRWRRAFVIGTKASWRRINWDLHTVGGLWVSIALIVVTFTGVDFAFPDAVGPLLEVVTGGSLSLRAAADHALQHPLPPSSSPVMTVDQAIAAACRALPADAPPGYLSLPANPAAPFRVTGYYNGTAPFSQLVRVSLDPHTGAVLGLSSTRQQTRALRMEQYFATVHFGSFGGHGWFGVLIKVLWVVLGLAPAVLSVTGLIMYWNRKLRTWWEGSAKKRGTT
jgi:uncharacterized iron-regulated membrane protein